MSRIVAFIVKNIDAIFFACIIDKLDSSPVETKKIKHDLKKTAWAYAWAGVNTGMAVIRAHTIAPKCALTRATIVGKLCCLIFFGI